MSVDIDGDKFFADAERMAALTRRVEICLGQYEREEIDDSATDFARRLIAICWEDFSSEQNGT